MFGTKWDGAKAGLKAFLADPGSAGIRVAINFFPLDNNPTCDQFAYKPPAVTYQATARTWITTNFPDIPERRGLNLSPWAA